MRIRALLFITLVLAAVALAAKIATPPSKYVAPNERRVVRHVPFSGMRSALDEYYESRDSVHIPDGPGGWVTDTMVVAGDTSTIADVNVYLDVVHPFVRDLQVRLIRSDGPQALLIDLFPVSDAVNLEGWFDDASAVGILEADTPLVHGWWRPIDSLSAFHGLPVAATWILRVADRFYLDTGYVAAWGLDFNGTNAVTGTIENSETRAPVRWALVQVEGRPVAASGDANGVFQIPRLDPGTYTFRFSKAFYDTLTMPGIEIQSGQTTNVPATMSTISGIHEYGSDVPPVSVPDLRSASMSIRVSGRVVIGTLTVLVNIRHTYVSDLILWLESPGGDSVLLADRVGGNGQNFTDCRFADSAHTPIDSGAAPFSGAFRPADSLSRLAGLSVDGEWRLFVADSGALDTGSIQYFELLVAEPSGPIPPADHPALPTGFVFYGNYPNPFNALTEFRFDLPEPRPVQLIIYNTLGQKVCTVLDEPLSAGTHYVGFDGGSLPSGLYVAHCRAGSESESRKIVLLK